MKKKEKTRKFKAKKNYQRYITNDHQLSVFVQLHLIHKELLAVWKHRLLTCRLCTHEFSAVQSLSHVQLFATPWTAAHEPPCPSLSPGVCSSSCPLSQWCHPTISFSVTPSPPAFKLCQHQALFQWVSSSHQMASVVGLQLQRQSFQWIFRVDFL